LPPRLLTALKDGFRFQWRSDGPDYRRILDEFKAGTLETTRLGGGHPDRSVYKVYWDGRPFVLKWDRENDPRPEKRWLEFWAGTAFSRLIQLTAKSRRRGGNTAQDVYLVAERLTGRHFQEGYLIAEYVEGIFLDDERLDENAPLMAEAVGRLHREGLASSDLHPGNFIVTPLGIRIIDLSLKSPLIICQANDILRMERDFGVRMPASGPGLGLILAGLKLIWSVRLFLRKWRGKS